MNIPLETSPGCQRCEVLPPKLHGPGILYMRFPLSHSLGKAQAHLRREGWRFTEQEGTVNVELPDEDLVRFALSMSAVLNPLEQEDVRTLFVRQGQTLRMADYLEADSLARFIGRAQTGWLLDMMQEGRLTTLFQPIIDCQTETTFGYECLLRGVEEDRYIAPLRLLGVARTAGLLFHLDLAARRSAIREAARHQVRDKIFINFTPTAIYDPRNCLRSTVNLANECGFTPEQIVFEVIESEFVDDTAHLNSILDYYREQGFKVALDDIGSGYSSLNLLAALRPDYLKLDRELISGVASDAYKATIAGKLLETARSLGVQTIAEGVETRSEYEWLCNHGAHFAQGYYFARPASPPPRLSLTAQPRELAA